jgi:hypothetical protein
MHKQKGCSPHGRHIGRTGVKLLVRTSNSNLAIEWNKNYFSYETFSSDLGQEIEMIIVKKEPAVKQEKNLGQENELVIVKNEPAVKQEKNLGQENDLVIVEKEQAVKQENTSHSTSR